jgi:hypothetical protein
MIRYYPSFRIIENLNTSGKEFTLEGEPYSGKYYETFDGRFFTGANPQTGPSQEIFKVPQYQSTPGLDNLVISTELKNRLAQNTRVQPNRLPGSPTSFYPQPTEEDYRKGYVVRYFTKKENEKGYIIEISEDEYNAIVNGTTDYDIRLYQVTKILWKLTGPLKSTRQSQYNIIPGIIDTNQRLTEAANKNFLGIVEFIGGDYTKFARPTM